MRSSVLSPSLPSVNTSFYKNRKHFINELGHCDLRLNNSWKKKRKMLVLYHNYPCLHFVSIHQNHRSKKSSVLTSNWRRQGFQPQDWNITFLIFYYFMLVLSVSSPKSKWDKIFLLFYGDLCTYSTTVWDDSWVKFIKP